VPVRVGVSIGDTLAALHGVIGVLMALRHREVNGGLGQVVDVALYESVFNVMESLLPEYDAFGAVRGAAGSALPGIAPSNAYACGDGAYVLVAGNGDSIFRRLMQAIARDDLAQDPALARNDGRVKRVAEIDAAIGAWTVARPIAEVLRVLEGAAVPVGRIYSVADISADPQYQARQMILQTADADGRPLKVPGIVPKLSSTPGRLRTPAPKLGQHNGDLLRHAGWPAANDDRGPGTTA
jgi:crotonobetainyl-CoA:carnitine CoA-transferase CaiB-like acyl-CoA transferase